MTHRSPEHNAWHLYVLSKGSLPSLLLPLLKFLISNLFPLLLVLSPRHTHLFLFSFIRKA
jgi:hypothetical protein